ncbi:hypothetical protein DFH29DRAFT_1081734 [Suillus ampliporus]|nr:hypothetical protein DFH29DRAFT_1081734 [Suillus ampliporus]
MAEGWPSNEGDLSMLIDTDVNRSVDSGFIDITMGPSSTFSTPSTRGSRMSAHDWISSALKILRDGRISVLDLLVKILDPSEVAYSTYRDRICVPSAKEKQLGTGKVGKSVRFSVGGFPKPDIAVSRKMDDAKRCLHMTLDTITPELLLTCNFQTTLASVVHKNTPLLFKIIMNAAQTDRARENNKIKDCGIACNVIITQLSVQRSHHSIFFSASFTLFCWTNGVSRQTIEALHKCGLCISFTSLLKLLERLAEQCINRACQIARGPHVMCYDNINISTSIFVEQRASAPAKVQSGTFAVLYEVRNGNPAHMQLAPILQRAQVASNLMFNADVRPTYDQMMSHHRQLCIHVVNILLEACSDFKDFPPLLHHERRKLLVGYRTKQYPLCTSTIDESSVSRNIAVINDVYINQLKMTHEELLDRAIPSFNDQSTNARIRGAKTLRTQDINPFTQLQTIQLGFGLFHLCLNLVWALLHVHRGSIHQVGSLSYFFALLDRTRLGCEHPDYHTLLSTLLQILRGIILNGWKVECGYSSLASFALSRPTTDDLLNISDTILLNHATPTYEPSKKKHSTGLLSTEPEPDNTAHQNLRLLTRDLLYVLELVTAISSGDWGRVEDILGSLAMIFRGAGSNNYCTEILHFLFNLKKVWTPEFADIMRDNALVNFSGLEGHSMPIDLNIEHLIKFLKMFFAAKGIYSTWDRLGNISATVDLLQNVKKQVGSALGIAYHGLNHSSPDTSASVWKVAKKINELRLHQFTSDRTEDDAVKPVVDTLMTGEKKMKTSTLATFNRKVRKMLAGEGFEQEEDEIPSLSFDLNSMDEE